MTIANAEGLTQAVAPASGFAPVAAAAEENVAARASERMVFIDGLRGLAALAVMLMHFFHPGVSPLHAPLAQIMPNALQWMLLQGHLGVQVFFVLSGFVIAYTLSGKRITAGYAANFMLRRSIRLDPPYWTMIALLIACKYVVWRAFGFAEMLSWFGGWRNVALNMAYLYNLVKIEHVFGIVSVAWTLCLEVQFYLVLITLLTLGGWAGRRWEKRAEAAVLAAVLVPLTTWSLYVWFRAPRFDFVGMWFMFFAGVALWWATSGRMRVRWLVLLVGAIVMGGVGRWDGRALTVAATVIAIFAAARTGGMQRWLGGRVMQYLGRISYSLYLGHMAIGVLAAELVWELGGRSVPAAAVAYVVACMVAVGFSHLLHVCVEAPFVRLAKRLKPLPQARPA